MKKGKKAALAAVCAVLFLVACSGNPDAGAVSGEMVAPEVSSEDLLVSSLEYLLEEDAKAENPEAAVKESSSEAVKAEETKASDRADGQQGKTPAATVICYGKDMESGLLEETIAVDEVTPEVLLGALARHNIVPLLNTKVLSLQEQEEDGKKVLYLDLSDTFREYLLTMSKEAECIIIASVANTFLANYDVDAVYITVEGEPLVTSHTEYREAVRDYTPGELMGLVMPEEDGSEVKVQ